MVYSPPSNLDRVLAGSGSEHEKQTRGSEQSSPIPALESTRQTSPAPLDTSTASILTSRNALGLDLVSAEDTLRVGKDTPDDVTSMHEERLFFPTGLLADPVGTSNASIYQPTSKRLVGGEVERNASPILGVRDALPWELELNRFHDSEDESMVNSMLDRGTMITSPLHVPTHASIEPLFILGNSSPFRPDIFVTPPMRPLALPDFSPSSSLSPQARELVANSSAPIEDLFSPSPLLSERVLTPAPKSKPKYKPRAMLGYVAVPPFPPDASKSDYKGGRVRNAHVQHHVSLVDALNASAKNNGKMPYVSRKGKGRARDSDTESSDEDESGPIVYMPRPLKRKGKERERDSSYGPRPKKKVIQRRDKDANSASSSSAYAVPVSLDNGPAKPRGRPKRKLPPPPQPQLPIRRIRRDAGLSTLSLTAPNDPQSCPPASYTSLRHLRAALSEVGERRKLWAARYDVGEELVATPVAAVPDPTPPPPKRKAGPKPKPRGLMGVAPTPEGTNHPVVVSSSKRGKGRARVQAFGSISPDTTTLRHSRPVGFSGETMPSVGSSLGVAAMANDPLLSVMDEDHLSTSADAEGETNVEYFCDNMGDAFSDEGEESSMGFGEGSLLAIPPLDPTGAAASRYSGTSQTSSAPIPPTSSSLGDSPDSPIHDDDSNGVTVQDRQQDPDVFHSGPDPSLDNDAFFELDAYDRSPWLNGDDGLRNDPNGIAGNGTIDPSLLGGAEIVGTPSPSPSPPLHGHLQEEGSTHGDYYSQVLVDEVSPIPSPQVSPHNFSKRIPRPRVMGEDMVATDKLSLSDSDSDDSSTEYRGSEAGSASDYGPGAIHHPSYTPGIYQASTSTSSTASMNGSQPAAAPVLVPKTTKKPDNGFITSSCHQCRRSTSHPKMSCSNIHSDGTPCKHKFCDWCIGRRYPNMTFDRDKLDFVCPKCEEKCNCTVCTRKRGEVYVSSGRGRGGGKGRSLPGSSKPTRGDGTTGRRKKLMDLAPPLNPTKYWGTIYGTSGEKIGTGYVGEDDTSPRVVVPRLMRSVRFTRKPTRREFIGKLQASWGLSDFPVTDLVSSKGAGKRKAKETNTVPPRLYIGRMRRPRPVADVELALEMSPPSSPGSEESELTPVPDTPDEHWLEPAEGQSLTFGFPQVPIEPTPSIDAETTRKALVVALAAVSQGNMEGVIVNKLVPQLPDL